MTSDLFNLTGKVAIVTGASRGLGQYFGRALARDPVVQQAEDQHLFPDSRVGMGGPFLIDDPLLLLIQLDVNPSHGAPPCNPVPSR